MSGWSIGDDLTIQISHINYWGPNPTNPNFEIYVEPTSDIGFCLQETNCPITHDNLYVNNITQDSAEIGWQSSLTGNSWNIEYGLSDFVLGTGTTINNVTNLYNLTGLAESTNYDVYVQEICNAGNFSPWKKLEFMTSIQTITEPYSSDFSTFPVDSWYKASSGNPTSYAIGSNTGNWDVDLFANDPNHINGNSARIISDLMSEEWLISPRISLDDEQYTLSFETALTKLNNSIIEYMSPSDEIQLLITLDNGISWINLHTWNNTNSPTQIGVNFSLDVSSYNNNSVRFAFWANRTNSYGRDYIFFIDNFNVSSNALSVIDYEESLFSLYPNPTKDYLIIDSQTELLSSTIRNVNGRILKKINFKNSDLHIKLDVKDLMSGMYFLELESYKGKFVNRFIKH